MMFRCCPNIILTLLASADTINHPSIPQPFINPPTIHQSPNHSSILQSFINPPVIHQFPNHSSILQPFINPPTIHQSSIYIYSSPVDKQTRSPRRGLTMRNRWLSAARPAESLKLSSIVPGGGEQHPVLSILSNITHTPLRRAFLNPLEYP